MHLAQTETFKAKFRLFITFPSDPKLMAKLDRQLEGLYANPFEHTSFSLNDQQGWAFFPIEEQQLPSEVEAYVTTRINDIITYEQEWGPEYDRSIERVPYPGNKVFHAEEVDCFYFYDNVEWYR